MEPHSHPEEIHSGGEITTSESCAAATGSALVLHDISSSDALTNETPTEECKNYNIGSASHLVILGLPDDAELLCDIGKLLESHVNIHGISRDDIYRLLMTEPDANPSHYPRTQQSTGSSRQFQPL